MSSAGDAATKLINSVGFPLGAPEHPERVSWSRGLRIQYMEDPRQQVSIPPYPIFNVSASPSVLSFDRSVSVHLSFVCFAAGLILLIFFSFFSIFCRPKETRRAWEKNLGGPRADQNLFRV